MNILGNNIAFCPYCNTWTKTLSIYSPKEVLLPDSSRVIFPSNYRVEYECVICGHRIV